MSIVGCRNLREVRNGGVSSTTAVPSTTRARFTTRPVISLPRSSAPVASTTSVPTSVIPSSTFRSSVPELVVTSLKTSSTSTTVTSFDIQSEVPTVSMPIQTSTEIIFNSVENTILTPPSESSPTIISVEVFTSTFNPPTPSLATSSAETEFSTESLVSVSTEPIVVSVVDVIRILNGTDAIPIVEGTTLMVVYLVCGSFTCAILLVILGGLIHFCVKRSRGVLHVTSNTQRKTIRIPPKFNDQLIRIRKTHSVSHDDARDMEMVDINGISISSVEPIRVNSARDNNDMHGGYAIPFPGASCSSFQLPATSVRKQPHFVRKQLTQVSIHSPPPIPARSSSNSSVSDSAPSLPSRSSRPSSRSSGSRFTQSSSQFGIFSRGSSVQSHNSSLSDSNKSNVSTLTRSSQNGSVTHSSISVSDLTDRTLSNLVSRQVSNNPDGDDVTLSGLENVHDSSLEEIYF